MMYQIMKITIYLLIAFMLMGTEKCDSPYLKKPYVPDPICKRDLEEANRYLTSTYSSLNLLDGMTSNELFSMDFGSGTNGGEKHNLASAISTIQSTQKYASKPLQANKIKDGKRRLIEVMIKDLRSHMPILKNYDITVSNIAIHTRRVMTNNYSKSSIEELKKIMKNRESIVSRDWGSTRAKQLEAFGKIRKVIAIVQEYRKPLADLIKDGCVARS
ncbi:hypothetical protein OAT11_07615 [Nitrospinaceae bacterium]|nr:hypothetical protein [Nitrospinaceae bacterium]